MDINPAVVMGIRGGASRGAITFPRGPSGIGASGGDPVVVDERLLVEAYDLARETTGINVDHTGAAGLAGLLQSADFSYWRDFAARASPMTWDWARRAGAGASAGAANARGPR